MFCTSHWPWWFPQCRWHLWVRVGWQFSWVVPIPFIGRTCCYRWWGRKIRLLWMRRSCRRRWINYFCLVVCWVCRFVVVLFFWVVIWTPFCSWLVFWVDLFYWFQGWCPWGSRNRWGWVQVIFFIGFVIRILDPNRFIFCDLRCCVCWDDRDCLQRSCFGVCFRWISVRST